MNIEWNHKSIKIKDIRKLNNLYAIRLDYRNSSPLKSETLFIKDTIFNERLESYFLKPIDKISRKEILEVYWNFYITKGYYVKIENGELIKHPQNENKYYVSFLDIEGDLSMLPTKENTDKKNIQQLNS